ncbi:hypothetical protein [Streptomyces atratus]|uniref:hypothetical protein n=1 Tax=Streptomyces atratus TaxID=1893 RepID=UPI0033EA9F0E
MSRSSSRTSLALVGAATALAVLTACGGSGDDDDDSAAPGSDGKPVSITFWGWTKGLRAAVGLLSRGEWWRAGVSPGGVFAGVGTGVLGPNG